MQDAILLIISSGNYNNTLEKPEGWGFGPVRTKGAIPPTAIAAGPSRSRSHGRLRRPNPHPSGSSKSSTIIKNT